MKHKFFAVPVLDSEQAEAELNKKQGRPYVSSVYESVWDDRLQGAPCSSH